MIKKTLVYFAALWMMASGAYAQEQKKDKDQLKLLKATIAGKLKGDITKDELLNAKGIEILDSTYHVTEFKMSMVGKDFPYREFDGRSNVLDYRMRKAIKEAPTGTKVYFEYIKCINQDKDIRLISTLQVVLK